MKVYYDRSDTGRCEQISLGEALRLVFDNYKMASWTHAADMLHKSGHSSTIVVDKGCVWIEDDVPVLDFDRVVKDWWALKSKELNNDVYCIFTISCAGSFFDEEPTVKYFGRDNVFYSTSEEALATFKQESNSVEHTPASEPQDLEQDDPDATRGPDGWYQETLS